MKKNAAKGYEKTKPKQTQFPKRAKMDVNTYYTEVYENILCIPNQGKQTQTNPTCSELVEPISNPTLNFLSARGNFPSWFGPVFLVAIGLLICIIGFYIWQLTRTLELVKPPNRYQTAFIWLLLILSVPCTSAFHQFAPFRLDAILYWPRIPSEYNLIKYNFILTAGSLLIVLILTVLHSIRRRTQAVTGLVILAAIMLVPNDNCSNDFNLPWIRWAGASPLMFMPNSVVLLIGYFGLHGIWPRAGILLMAGINVCVLLLGLGHLTRLIW